MIGLLTEIVLKRQPRLGIDRAVFRGYIGYINLAHLDRIRPVIGYVSGS